MKQYFRIRNLTLLFKLEEEQAYYFDEVFEEWCLSNRKHNSFSEPHSMPLTLDEIIEQGLTWLPTTYYRALISELF